ncbi:MAG: LptF/LptG family permease [Spirochaetaceae bacterium]|jgi:lipopolysaccharide export system permease protein|nr:LptF/LptG family permease [Spirochaetaceae bacterium]
MRNKSRTGTISGTIFKYIFKETTFSFLVSFFFFFFIFFVNQLLLMAQDILTKKVPFDQVALLVLFSIPSIIAMSAPFATLLGTLITIGRLSSDNEILVMLTSGLSYRNIFVPTLLVGILVSMLSFLANDVLLPMGTIEFSRLYRKILTSTPALEIEANSVKKIKDTVVITGDVTGKKIGDMVILDKTGDGERRVILAKGTEFVDAGKEGIRLDMENAFIHSSKEIERRDYDYAQTSMIRYRIRTDELIQQATTVSAREMSSRDVLVSIHEKEKNLVSVINDRNSRALQAALELESALRKGPGSREWRSRDNFLAAFNREFQAAQALTQNRDLLIYRLEFYKKFSIPFGSFAFIFLAVPLGLFAKKSGQAVGFILGIIISVVYWAFLLGGQNMGMRLGVSPFWCMWLPNILAFGIGLIMCINRVRK